MLAHPIPPSKPQMIQNITNDEDVKFYWLIASADFEIDDQEIHDLLLEKIAELYVTVRGFSYASGPQRVVRWHQCPVTYEIN